MKNLTSEEQLLFQDIDQAITANKLPSKDGHILKNFYLEYAQGAKQKISSKEILSIFKTLLSLMLQQIAHPHTFSAYHQKIKSPFDYHAFALSFVYPLMDDKHSDVDGKEHLKEIEKALSKNENVVFLANHQTETDPQIIELLIKDEFPTVADRLIFVAGERVITDPAAVPFSLGTNLLCIYSKKYIDYPPEKKTDKQMHNQKTLRKMTELLSEGGKVIYVAPSGGRDRKNNKGIVEVAPYDPNSVELFYLLAKKAKQKTRFYPMALWTYDLLPPPSTVQKEIGEERHANFTPCKMAIGNEIPMEEIATGEKKERKNQRAIYIHQKVCELYKPLEP
jgi:glycerol-3-phosphate O-acyltransferase